jgi:5-methylcytosine-specific restriction endonuclease McrA
MCSGTQQLQVHHRIPLEEGGRNTLSNLELRCKNCHTDAPVRCNEDKIATWL